MTGPSLDLDALREKAEAVGSTWSAYQDAIGTDGEVEACQASLDAREAYRLLAVPSTFLAVLALVEEQRARISTLEEALRPFSALAEHAVERGEGGYGHWLHNTGKEQISTWLGPTDFLHARDALAGPPTEEATDA